MVYGQRPRKQRSQLGYCSIGDALPAIPVRLLLVILSFTSSCPGACERSAQSNDRPGVYHPSGAASRLSSEVQKPGFIKPGKINNSQAPHFSAFALNELAHDLHVKVSDLSRSGLVVTTTLDLAFQNKVSERCSEPYC